MFVKKFSIALALLVASAGIAAAQSPTLIKQFNAWGAYSYQTSAGKVCYVLSVPKEKSPPGVDHGDIFFLVSQRPGQNISYEPQAMMGYPLQESSKVTVTIDARNFTLFTKDKSAWVENAAEEPALVASMKSGKGMSVSAKSRKGTGTNYVYSLSGISAALKQIETCK
ncbi:invasion associated locus B family protein [Pararhizobium sp.]|uniref:invasion associated locus B family protein n=1 Tax=Pararhizobium sp. TaxID=1977563 RepID=UPI00271CC65F|nr:invasion associated locus B family protein [Pararhizobium sp.]MDO9416555.1 invasion associated locus B family protein [Pararhizobium sp.]